MKVVVVVIKSESRSSGFSLSHNQSLGFKGVTGRNFGWYRYKKDAIERAKELTKCWN